LKEEEEKAEGEKPETETADNELNKLKDKDRIDWAKVVNVINSNLPSSIRVHTTKKVTKVFDVKLSARSRIYEYLGPVSMFVKDPTNITEDDEQKTLERLRTLVQKFKGTHNFHNYTNKMRASDPKAQRYIMEFDCNLVDFGEQGRFYKFRIRGQSFIYHQIRKMIGIMIQVIQEDLKDGFIDNSFFQNSVNIWLAPPQGLFLDRVTFDAYNKKTDIPEKLEFNQEEEDKVTDFKDNVIYPIIVEAEFKNKTFTEWLNTTKNLQAQGKVQLMDESSEGEDDEDGESGQKGGKRGGGRKGGKPKND
jgi:tRNA pseudouridine38-40 synthase